MLQRDRTGAAPLPFLGARGVEAIDWARADARTVAIPIGLFGASTSAAAAIVVGAARPAEVSAIVSRRRAFGRRDPAFRPGVIYRPESERWSHYFDARLSRQFDALVWFEETSSVNPLAGAPAEGAPDIYPFGL